MRPERENRRRGVRRSAGVRQAPAGHAARSRGWSASRSTSRVTPRRACPLHPPPHRGDGRNAERHAAPAHAAPIRLGHGAEAMRRAYRRHRYLAILDRVRAAIPQAATPPHHRRLPGETEQDFLQTLDVAARRASRAPSPSGTHRAAARPPRRCPPRSRPRSSGYRQRAAGRAESPRCPGRKNQKSARAPEVYVLVADGKGRKDGATQPHVRPGRITGWSTSRPAVTGDAPRPGDIVTTPVATRGAPTYLLADGTPRHVRRTPAAATPGPARHARAQLSPRRPGRRPAGPVLLGMPHHAPHPNRRTSRLAVLRSRRGPLVRLAGAPASPSRPAGQSWPRAVVPGRPKFPVGWVLVGWCWPVGVGVGRIRGRRRGRPACTPSPAPPLDRVRPPPR